MVKIYAIKDKIMLEYVEKNQEFRKQITGVLNSL
jgi:hypothetical protein